MSDTNLEVYPLPDPPFTIETPITKIFKINPDSPVIIDNGIHFGYLLGII